MRQKISDFVIVYRSLQILCKRLDCDLIDLNIEFSDKLEKPYCKDNTIYLNNNATLIDTYANIFSIYINNLDKICGRNIDNLEFRHSVTNYFLAIVRDFVIQYNTKPQRVSESIGMKLDQFHVPWMLLKNIICPYKKIKLENLIVVANHSSIFDAVAAVEIDDKDILFVNLDIEKESVRSAFVLVKSLQMMLTESENSAEGILREMFASYFMRDRFIDFLGLVYTDDTDVASFMGVLAILCQSQELENMALNIKKNVKTAQSSPYVGNWWFLGLHEKMLEAVRGADYTTTISLKDFSKDLWDKVEKERKTRGLTELPFESLLRIQSEDKTVEPGQILQSLLSKVRIW